MYGCKQIFSNQTFLLHFTTDRFGIEITVHEYEILKSWLRFDTKLLARQLEESALQARSFSIFGSVISHCCAVIPPW